MGNLISRKREKAFALFRVMGADDGAERFAELFREMYPSDWAKIVAKYQEEELIAPSGKRHPMPEPEVYLREMYRNMWSRWLREGPTPRRSSSPPAEPWDQRQE